MDIFDTFYYKINKGLLQFLGCWPYQKRMERYSLRFMVLFLNTTVFIPEILYLIKGRNNMHMIINCLSVANVQFDHIAKFCVYIFESEKMMKLISGIKDDWKSVHTKEEFTIIHRYADQGRKMSFVYLIWEYGCAITYISLMLEPRLVDVLLPLNESRPYLYIFETEYVIDKDKYYTPIIIHQIVTCLFIGMTSIIATDGTYTVYAHHACGLFAIVRHRLSNLPYDEISKGGKLANEKKIHEEIVACVNQHRRAIWYSETLESAHVGLLCVLLLTGIVGLSVSGVQAMLHTEIPSEAARSICLCLGHFMHIFYYCWNGQKILDHSTAIFDASYNTDWYTVLDRTTKPLIFMMLRSTKPCLQTAGKLFPMTLMNFTVIVKTSMSYFTMLLSFQ